MKICFKTGRNENGSAILAVVFLLAILTIIGISASNTSEVELNITGNDRRYRTAFYVSESGNYAAAKRVSEIIENGVTPGAAAGTDGIQYLDGTDDELYDEVLGLKNADDTDSYDPEPDLYFKLGGVDAAEAAEGEEQPVSLPAAEVEIDLKRFKSVAAAGESAEFGTGAESQGTKSVVIIPVALASEGKTDAHTKARIRSIYYKYFGKQGGGV